MNQVEPQTEPTKPVGTTLERLCQKAEIELNRNRKTQEQLNLAFFGLRNNFKN